MPRLKIFTRKAEGNDYPKNMYPQSLANSIHFALKDENDCDTYEVLNQNYGILFAATKVNSNNTLFPRGLKNPKVAKISGEYYIMAEYVDKNGNAVDEEFLCVYKTFDFVNFLEHQNFRKSEFESLIKNANEKIEFSDEILISKNIALEMKNRWLPLKAVNLELPDNLSLNEISEIDKVKAKVIYSDGSIDEKHVDWDKNSICKIENGSCEISGKIKPAKSRFPLTVGLADPVIYFRDGKWYYIATNDNVNDIGLYLRRADSLEGLFVDGFETSVILDYDEKRKLCQTFWAPEFHEIGGKFYILFAVSSEKWGPQCHMMKLKKGGDLMKAEDWEAPVRVCRSDGNFLTEDAITLDMTYFKAGEKSYLAWSYREKIGTPLDSGSMICIATINEEKPWVLTSAPVVISRPLYAWENHSGTINNEGPYPLILGDEIFLSYSGGDACGPAYVVGYLRAKVTDDLLNPKSWKKEPTAMLHLMSVKNRLGPGHNSFFKDENGKLMIAYHAQEREKYNCRCSAYHRVHISKSGLPLLNVSDERDLPEEMQNVKMRFALASLR